jgi:hypothetical protein
MCSGESAALAPRAAEHEPQRRRGERRHAQGKTCHRVHQRHEDAAGRLVPAGEYGTCGTFFFFRSRGKNQKNTPRGTKTMCILGTCGVCRQEVLGDVSESFGDPGRARGDLDPPGCVLAWGRGCGDGDGLGTGVIWGRCCLVFCLFSSPFHSFYLLYPPCVPSSNLSSLLPPIFSSARTVLRVRDVDGAERGAGAVRSVPV